MNSQTPQLKIDKDFRNLIQPLKRREYRQLKKNILEEGCNDSIITWNGIIIDGHNRYKICTEHNIPFTVIEMNFESRPAVIAWICKNQLARKDLSEEVKKYLIGVQYEAEKVACKIMSLDGKNRCRKTNEDYAPNFPLDIGSKLKTAKRIAEENGITHMTVRKYAAYARALEKLRKKQPDLVKNVLLGKYKISHKNIVGLNELPPEQLEKFVQAMTKCGKAFVQFSTTRDIFMHILGGIEQPPSEPTKPTIKDMPTFDPNAQFIELSLTIPSWISSLQHAYVNITSVTISYETKCRLSISLHSLSEQIQKILATLSED